jgi:SpoVK/Ycf46/Vps4 family AAA+-type ATPase
MIDPAMLRPGRFDAKVFVGLPDRVARREILASSFAARPVDAHVDLDQLADRTEGLAGAELVGLVETAADSAFLRAIARGSQDEPIRMSDLTASLPERASRGRFQRR